MQNMPREILLLIAPFLHINLLKSKIVPFLRHKVFFLDSVTVLAFLSSFHFSENFIRA